MVSNSKQSAAKTKGAPDTPEAKNQLDDTNITSGSDDTNVIDTSETKNQLDDTNITSGSDDTDVTDKTKTEGVKKVLKKDAPQLVRMRIRGNYNFLHPRSGKLVTFEFKDFEVDNWIKAQLAAGLVEVQKLDGTPLQLVDTELVEVG